jgi:alpha-ribazole phosphatase
MTEPVITDWYFIRHAPVIGGKSGIYSSADEPADIGDTSKFTSLAARLPGNAEWYTSPLKRTQMTANTLAALKNNPAVITDNRLAEQDFGNWFGLTPKELWDKIDHLKGHNWAWLSATTTPEGGESYIDVWARTNDFMNILTKQSGSKPKIIISHAGIIRAFIGNALGLSPDVALSLGINTLSLTHMQHTTGNRDGGNWRLVCQNS